jgi:hypothetical protein
VIPKERFLTAVRSFARTAYVDQRTGARRPQTPTPLMIPRPALLACCACVSELHDRVSLVGDMLDLTGRRTAVHAGSQRSGAPASSSCPNFSSSFTLPPPWALLVCGSAYASSIAGSFPVSTRPLRPTVWWVRPRLRAHQRGSRDSSTASAHLTAASAAVADISADTLAS